MTSSSSLYGSVTQQNTNSGNSTSLYGEAGTPIPDSSGNVVVRGDLYVLSGNILTTAATGNIFPTNATTINLGNAATTISIGAGTGTTTINNNLVADSGDFGNITIGVVDGNTIATTSGDLNLLPTGNNGVNITSGSDAPTLITRNSAVTNVSVRGLSLSAETSLTPAVGFGNTLEYQVEAQPGNVERAGYISVNLTDITAGSEDFNMNFGLMQNGATYATKMILDSTGSLALDNDLTIGGTNVNLAQATTFGYSESNNRLNRPEVQSTTGNSSGLRVKAPNTGTSAAATLSVGNSSDSSNTEFLSLQARGSGFSDTFRFFTGEYIANVLNATNKSIAFTDNTNTYATVNPAGPTIPTDLTTKAYVDAIVIDNTTYTINASSTTGGANFNLVGTDLTTDTIKYNSGTGVTVSRTDANTIDFAIGQAVATTSNVTFADVIVSDDLTVQGNNVNLASGTTIGYNDNDTRANRLQIQSTTGNTTGLRITAPNATTSAVANLTAFSTNDYDNGEFIALQATGSTTAPFSIRTGKFTAGVLSASGEEINITDGGTTYASINPAGPTNSTDLTTKSYVDGLIPNVPTYDTTVVPATGGVDLQLREIDVPSITIVGTTTFLGGTNVTVSETSPNVITISAPDTNTTYDFNASSTTGGANLNLVGSDSTTDTVKLTNGGHITATYTSGTEVTLGSDATDANTANAIVSRDASGNFSASGATLGNITVGVADDQTITTTSGNLILDSVGGTLQLNDAAISSPVAQTWTVVDNNSSALSIGATGKAGLLKIDSTDNAERVVTSGNLTVNGSQVLITQNTTYVPPTSALSTVTGTNGVVAVSSTGGANGYGAGYAARYHSGDTSAGVNNAAALVLSSATGSSSAPAGSSANQVLGALNFDGYTAGTSNNYVSQIATANAGGGFVAVQPIQAQGYARQAFTNSTTVTTAVTGASGTGSVATLTFTTQNTAPYAVGQSVTIAGMTPGGYNGTYTISAATTSSISYSNATTGFTSGGTIAAANTVTAAGTGFRVRGFANSTNITPANRFNFMDLTASAATFKSNAYTFANEVITGSTLTATNYMTLGATVGSINQDTFTLKNTAGTTTYATLNSTSATLNGDTVALKNTAGTSTYANFATGGATITTGGATEVIRTATTSGANPALLLKRSTTATAAPIDNDGTGLRISTAGSSGTNYGIGFFNYLYQTPASGSDHEFYLGLAKGDQTGSIVDSVQTISSKLTNTRILAGTAGAAGTTATVAQFSPTNNTLKADALTLQTYAGASLVGTAISYNRVYGQWQYDATLTPAAANTGYAVPFQGANATIDFANIASAASTSRIIPGAAGMFKLQFSAQVENSDNGQDHNVSFWWRKNGTDISNSAGYFTVPKAGAASGALIVGWDNMVQTANTTDYFELIYAVSDTSITLPFIAAAAPRPGAAAVFLTLIPIGA